MHLTVDIHYLRSTTRTRDAKFEESKHPRGQPENKGEFVKGGGGGSEEISPLRRLLAQRAGVTPEEYQQRMRATKKSSPSQPVSEPVKTLPPQQTTPLRPTSTIQMQGKFASTPGYMNPSVNDVARMLQSTIGKQNSLTLRFVQDKDGNAVFFNAWDLEHYEAVNHLRSTSNWHTTEKSGLADSGFIESEVGTPDERYPYKAGRFKIRVNGGVMNPGQTVGSAVLRVIGVKPSDYKKQSAETRED